MTTIKQDFAAAEDRRVEAITRKKECAAFTIPSILPEDYLTQNDSILRPYQSLGADGVSNLTSKMLTALFSPGSPWFAHRPAKWIEASGEATQDEVKLLELWLYGRDLAIQHKLDSMRWRPQMRTAIEHVLVIGDMLIKLTDDYKLRVYRLDQWVMTRGYDGQVLRIITRDKLDYDMVDPVILEAANIGPDTIPADPKTGRKIVELYTDVETQRSGGVHIRQEMNGVIVTESHEPVSPYIACGYVEMPGEDYSRSFIEERALADLRSYNGLTRAILEGMAAMARVQPVLDEARSGGLTPRDLMKPNGEVLIGDVQDGTVQGVGFIRTDKDRDFSVAMQFAAVIEGRLGKQMLLEMAAQPQGERVTATQIMRIARELEGALGAPYAQIASELQRPLLDRLVYQMVRDRLIPTIPDDLKHGVETEVLTGLSALSRQSNLERMQAFAQIASQLPPEALQKVKWSAMLTDAAMGFNLDHDKYLKSDEEVQRELQEQMAAHMQSAAQQQAVATAGNVAEQLATQAQ